MSNGFENDLKRHISCHRSREESKFNFAKPARDLDTLLEKMGAQRMMPTGFGDDQDGRF